LSTLISRIRVATISRRSAMRTESGAFELAMVQQISHLGTVGVHYGVIETIAHDSRSILTE
jgi:hypothetical protein